MLNGILDLLFGCGNGGFTNFSRRWMIQKIADHHFEPQSKLTQYLPLHGLNVDCLWLPRMSMFAQKNVNVCLPSFWPDIVCSIRVVFRNYTKAQTYCWHQESISTNQKLYILMTSKTERVQQPGYSCLGFFIWWVRSTAHGWRNLEWADFPIGFCLDAYRKSKAHLCSKSSSDPLFADGFG